MVKLTEDIVLSRCRSCDLASVKKLNCWGSELDDIKIMRMLKNVEVVSLSVNDIATLEDFQECANLQELYIRKNKIKNLNEICYLKRLPKLRTLWLADNPCATGSRYRMTVLKNLPNLTKLDNIPVEEDELNDAIEQGLDLSPPARQVGSESKIMGKVETSSQATDPENARALTLNETNKIRAELGLKPLAESKMDSATKKLSSGSKQRNANILHAVLALVKELDSDGLETEDVWNSADGELGKPSSSKLSLVSKQPKMHISVIIMLPKLLEYFTRMVFGENF